MALKYSFESEQLLLTFVFMKCCEFDNEEIQNEFQMLANKQLPTNKALIKAIFYKRCWLLIKSHINFDKN